MTITASNKGPVNPGSQGDQQLHELSQRVGHDRSWGDEPDVVEFDHVVTSAANVPFSGPETYVFAADEQGNIIDWMELPGSVKSVLAHDIALDGFLAAVNSASDPMRLTY